MPPGFFDMPESEDMSVKGRPDCKACALAKNAKCPHMAASGEGRKKILVIDQSPGQEEDRAGTRLVGPTGQIVRKLLNRSGIDPERDCRLISAVNCFPGNTAANGTHVKRCRPTVWKELQEFPPRVIIPFGIEAVTSLLGHRYVGGGSGFGGVERWRGWRIPDQLLRAWVCPTYHGSYILQRGGTDDVSYKITGTDVDRAVDMLDKPVPDYGDESSKVEILWTRKEIRRVFRYLHKLTTPVTVDYETTGLKPERKGHKILTCAVSDHGERAFSFPMSGVEKLLAEWLISPVPKVAANKKFEERWSRTCLGVHVKNWAWDTMLAAHWLDNRRGITSLKFQTCVRFGNPDYDSHVDAYKKGVDTAAHGANAFNNMNKLDPEQLLIYGGMDAMYEQRVYEQQKWETL